MNNLEALLELVELKKEIEEKMIRYQQVYNILSIRYPKLEQLEEYDPKVLRRQMNDIKNNHTKSDSIRDI